jgi:hypothetical protein
MSQTEHSGQSEPRTQFVLDLPAHGFDPGVTAPKRVAVDLVKDSRGFALDVGTETSGYRVELEHGRDELVPNQGYRGTTLIASEESAALPGIDQLDEWLGFVIEYATEGADIRALARA